MASKPKTDVAEPVTLADYRPVPQAKARHDGWTAERQRTFLTVLAETGCISQACEEAGVSSRSAYRLRQRSDATAFANAWDQALRLATLRLTTVAFERAVRGTVREFWRGGELVATTRNPSDKLLTFLLSHLLPRGEGPSRLDTFDATIAEVRSAFPASLDRLTDHEVPTVPITSRDFFPTAPGDPREES
jgi:hypothetical protein